MTVDQPTSDVEIRTAVQQVIKDVTCPMEAAKALEKIFPEGKPIWVKTMGPFQWKVFLRPYPDTKLHSIICDCGQ